MHRKTLRQKTVFAVLLLAHFYSTAAKYSASFHQIPVTSECIVRSGTLDVVPEEQTSYHVPSSGVHAVMVHQKKTQYSKSISGELPCHAVAVCTILQPVFSVQKLGSDQGRNLLQSLKSVDLVQN